MSTDDLKLFVNLFDFALGTAGFQTASMEMLIREIGTMKSIADLRRNIERLPDDVDKAPLRAQLERAEFEFDSRIAFEELKPLLKEQEANQAKIAEILAILKNGPGAGPPPPPPAGP
jgi:hypothetical protein